MKMTFFIQEVLVRKRGVGNSSRESGGRNEEKLLFVFLQLTSIGGLENSTQWRDLEAEWFLSISSPHPL